MEVRMIERFADIPEEELALMAKSGDREARNALFLKQRGLISQRTFPARRLLATITKGGGPIDHQDIDQEA